MQTSQSTGKLSLINIGYITDSNVDNYALFKNNYVDASVAHSGDTYMQENITAIEQSQIELEHKDILM